MKGLILAREIIALKFWSAHDVPHGKKTQTGPQRWSPLLTLKFVVWHSENHCTHSQLLSMCCHWVRQKRIGSLSLLVQLVSNIGDDPIFINLWLVWIYSADVVSVHLCRFNFFTIMVLKHTSFINLAFITLCSAKLDYIFIFESCVITLKMN